MCLVIPSVAAGDIVNDVFALNQMLASCFKQLDDVVFLKVGIGESFHSTLIEAKKN